MASFDPPVRKLFLLLYLAGFLMLVDQGIEVAVALLNGNPAPGLASWRFGAFGLIAGRLGFFVVADAFLFAAAVGLEHRLFLRFLGWGHLALAAILVAALFVFGLDAIEMQGRARSAMTGLLNLATLRAGAVVVLAIGLFAWAGITAVRATRKPRRKGEDNSPFLTKSR